MWPGTETACQFPFACPVPNLYLGFYQIATPQEVNFNSLPDGLPAKQRQQAFGI